ncbi:MULTISPECIES: vWA domain-containing protein [Amycolatopsis]|uniref:Putative metallopeptidase domain-containing protein n=2 Tax=Amycolatopsis TaxID=1813 RepID=A0ABW5I627_9PSEU
MSGARTDARLRERRNKAIDAGWALVRANTVLKRLAEGAGLDRTSLTGSEAWAVVADNGLITANRARDAEPAEWAWVFAHLLLHLGLGHLDEEQLAEADAITADRGVEASYGAACCVAVHRFAEAVRVGAPLMLLPELPGTDELSLARAWRETGVPEVFRALGTGGDRPCLALADPPSRWDVQYYGKSEPWTERFARGLIASATEAMEQAADARGQTRHHRSLGEWDRALGWFASSFPLLGAVAAGFTLVVDPEVVRAWDISVAAVDAEHGEIYVNPNAALTAEEWRFVLAHEMLHAALRHDRRALGRDPYLWNVACDYVINGWLVALGVGELPSDGLHDPQLAALSAESVYDTLTTDLRRARKLRTLGGREAGDVLGDWLSEPDAAARRSSRRAEPKPLPWREGDRAGGVDLDEFYRRALSQGLVYHHAQGRGLLPLGLEQEIRALDHPPLPWDAQLARWFDEHVQAEQPVRSYVRASRRQSATPDIPRPGRVFPEQLERRATFGVVLDTSGSMNAELLGKALGAIASYALARDVPAARVVFCDAAAYDAGYLAVEDIAGRVKVRGRGGTRLQPGVDLLRRAPDFPADGPVLIITDAQCDHVRPLREHAYLVPRGARLPFVPRGPVFRVE